MSAGVNVGPAGTAVHPMERDVALSVLNVVLGVWLIASAFLLRQAPANKVNSIAIGIVCIAVALRSIRRPSARWLYVPLSAWMVVSPWVVPLRDTTAATTLIALGGALLLGPLTEWWLALSFPGDVERRPAGP
jgi:hypothetical protein